MTNEDVTKLPKWAQAKIATLERENRALEETCDAFIGKRPEVTSGHVTLPKDEFKRNGSLPIASRTRVYFTADQRPLADQRFGEGITVYFDTETETLHIQGDTAVEILPVSSNCMNIKIRDRV